MRELQTILRYETILVDSCPRCTGTNVPGPSLAEVLTAKGMRTITDGRYHPSSSLHNAHLSHGGLSYQNSPTLERQMQNCPEDVITISIRRMSCILKGRSLLRPGCSFPKMSYVIWGDVDPQCKRDEVHFDFHEDRRKFIFMVTQQCHFNR